MGQHKFNQVAQANAVPKRTVQVTPLGEGYCLAGLNLVPTQDEEGNFCVVLTAICGRMSELVPIQPVPVMLAELAKVKVEDLRARIAAMLDGPKAEEPAAVTP